MLKDALAVTKSRHHLILLQFDIHYTRTHTTMSHTVSQFCFDYGHSIFALLLHTRTHTLTHI